MAAAPFRYPPDYAAQANLGALVRLMARLHKKWLGMGHVRAT